MKAVMKAERCLAWQFKGVKPFTHEKLNPKLEVMEFNNDPPLWVIALAVRNHIHLNKHWNENPKTHLVYFRDELMEEGNYLVHFEDGEIRHYELEQFIKYFCEEKDYNGQVIGTYPESEIDNPNDREQRERKDGSTGQSS